MAIVWLHCMAYFVIKTVPVRREQRRRGKQPPNRISKLNDKFKFEIVVGGGACAAATAASCVAQIHFDFVVKLTFNRFLCKYPVQSK